VRAQGRPLGHNNGVIEIGDRVMIISTTVRTELVTQPGGRLEIGEGSWINYGVSLSAHQSVRIGNRCLIGPYTNILDNNYHDILDHSRTPPSRPVVIGDDVWIGGRVIILPGVTIGDHAVIGAGAVVMEDIPARSIALGNPAKVIQKF
jgi:maltose O-acetyltransferase